MEEGCIFCGIVAGRVPADILYQDDKAIIIQDIHPRAPLHQLVIPKVHISSLNEAMVEGAKQRVEQEELLGHLVYVAIEQAKREGIASRGYRLVINCGHEGGQMVPHLHVHLLGGRRLSAAMG